MSTTLTAPTASRIALAIADATNAPSVHNTQPWSFRVLGDVIEVRADESRRLAVIDADGRAMALSLGAVLYGVRLALAVRLRRAPLTEVLAEPDDTGLVAIVRIGGPVQPTARELALHAALPRRRTWRGAFADDPVAPGDLQAMVSAAAVEGADLRVLDPDQSAWALRLTREADRVWRGDEAYREELRAWTRRPDDALDGVPEALGSVRDLDAQVPQRDFRAGPPVGGPRRRATHFEERPTLALLTTWGDRPGDAVVAGQALHRAWLTATTRGIGVAILQQALDLPDLRWLLRDPTGGTGHPQVLMRLGHLGRAQADRPATRSPRRHVSDVVEAPAENSEGSQQHEPE